MNASSGLMPKQPAITDAEAATEMAWTQNPAGNPTSPGSITSTAVREVAIDSTAFVPRRAMAWRTVATRRACRRWGALAACRTARESDGSTSTRSANSGAVPRESSASTDLAIRG